MLSKQKKKQKKKKQIDCFVNFCQLALLNIAIFVNWHYFTFLYQSKQQVVLNATRFFLAVW